MTPSDQEALASAQSIKSSQRKGCLSAILTLVIGIAISLFFPPAAICAVIGLIVVYGIIRSECQLHENVLRQFAATRNWYYEPQTELRRVEWRKSRVRFYCTASLLSINAIADRLISNDFAPRTPPLTGEFPRKQRASRQRSYFTGSPPFENVPEISIPLTDPPHVPPAGWNSTPIVSAMVEFTELPPARDEQQPPAALIDEPPRRRSAEKSSESSTQNVFDPSPVPEGGRKRKTNYAAVRSMKLRKAAIQIHGRNCSVCGFNFDEKFGEELAQGYIEVHHLNSIAAGVRHTDPATDLAPLCSNCHAMADRLTRHHPSPPRSIGELRELLLPASNLQEAETVHGAEALTSPLQIKSCKIREKKPRKGS